MASNVKDEYTFLEEEDALKCSICLDVARDPQQHDVCGKLLCKVCLEKHGRIKPCPTCKQGSNYFDDAKSKYYWYSVHSETLIW